MTKNVKHIERPAQVTVDGALMPTQTSQLRAARALLGWTSIDVSKKAGVSASTVQRLERGEGPIATGRYENVRAVVAVYREAGVVFLEEAGAAGVLLVRYLNP